MTKTELKFKRIVTICLLLAQIFIYVLAIDLLKSSKIIPIVVLIENIAISIFTLKTQYDIEREYKYETSDD